MKYIRLILVLSIFLGLTAMACGGPEAPAENPTLAPSSISAPSSTPAPSPTPAPSSTPAPTPTLSADDHVTQGSAYSDAGQEGEAVTEFQAALELEPENADAHVGLGQTFIDQDRFAEAVLEFEAALAIEPENEAAKRGLCVATAFVQPDQAEEQCLVALADHPEDAELHNGLGIALAKLKHYAEAQAAFEQAIQLNPDHYWAHYNLGYMFLQQLRLEEAAVELNLAIIVNPEKAKAHYYLGLTYAQGKDYSQALPMYEEALRLDPAMAVAYYDLGVIHKEMGQAEEAIVAFEKFLELDPETEKRSSVEAAIAKLQQPAELPPGTYLEFDGVIEADDPNSADLFSFFTSPAAFFGSGEDTAAITVQPQNGMDVSIVVVDNTKGEGVTVAEMNEAGPGGEERLTVTLPESDAALGVYGIKIVAVDGSGEYHASFSGSPAVGFPLSEDREANGVLGDQLAVFFAVSALGKSNEKVFIEAVPRPGDELDLFITSIDTAGNINLGTLNKHGVGEAEGGEFVVNHSVYLLIIGDQSGWPGRFVMKYDE